MVGVPNRRYVRTPATAPGPSGPQMLGAFGAIRVNPLGFLETAWRTYGDIVQFPIPQPPAYLINDPEAVRSVLVTNARAYGKRTIQYSALSLVTGEGLLVADTPQWRRQRPLVQPAFHHGTIARVVDEVGIAVGGLIDRWEAAVARDADGSPVIDVDEAMMHTALEVVGRALFGADLSADADRLVEATLEGLDVVIARARVPVSPPSWVPTPANRRLRRSVRELDDAVQRMIAQRHTRTRADEQPADMLDLLLSSVDDAGEHLDPTEVRDQVVTFIVAGHETVASALTWAWSLLADHPQALHRLQAESDVVLGGRLPTWEDIPHLPWARAVLDEALRLYPPAWLITRRALQDVTLGGRAVPAGAILILSPYLVHRHPELWPAPESFDPERFLTRIDPGRASFIPYGAGPRLCIGRDFATVEGTMILAALAGRFDLHRPGAAAPAALPLVTIRPLGGMPLRVTRRG